MKFILKTKQGRSLPQAVGDELAKDNQKLEDNLSYAAQAVANVIRMHFNTRFPGSQHYSPDKVTTDGPDVYVDVPGVNRAYHDIDIKPVYAKMLAIPLHKMAYGLSPRDVQGIFKLNGHNVLAIKDGASLICLYALKDHVHQPQDPSIMPSDESLAEAAAEKLIQMINTQ